MRHNQQLSDKELQEAARVAMEGRNQSQIARELGVHRSLITNALNANTVSRYASTLARIIEHCTDYRIETETITRHRVIKKDG